MVLAIRLEGALYALRFDDIQQRDRFGDIEVAFGGARCAMVVVIAAVAVTTAVVVVVTVGTTVTITITIAIAIAIANRCWRRFGVLNEQKENNKLLVNFVKKVILK